MTTDSNKTQWDMTGRVMGGNELNENFTLFLLTILVSSPLCQFISSLKVTHLYTDDTQIDLAID